MKVFIFNQDRKVGNSEDSPMINASVSTSELFVTICNHKIMADGLGEIDIPSHLNISDDIFAAKYILERFKVKYIEFANFDLDENQKSKADMLEIKKIIGAGVHISSLEASFINDFYHNTLSCSAVSAPGEAYLDLNEVSASDVFDYVASATSDIAAGDIVFVAVTSSGYEFGTLALIHSLRKFHAEDVIIIGSHNVDEGFIRENLPENCHLVLMQSLCVRDPSKIYEKYYNTLSKFYIYAMDKFRKVVFLDSDLLIMKPLDFIYLELEKDQATFSYGNPESKMIMTSSVMVVRPDRTVFERLIASVVRNTTYSGRGDHGYFIKFYGNNWHPIDNTFHISHKSLLTDADIEKLSPAVIHYHGFKPWGRAAGRGAYLSASAAHRVFYESLPLNLLRHLVMSFRAREYTAQCARMAKRLDP